MEGCSHSWRIPYWPGLQRTDLVEDVESFTSHTRRESLMPPKGGNKRKGPSDGAATPQGPSLAEQLSYLHGPRPFKNPYYTKNVNRRAKNLKTVLGQEREKDRVKREALRKSKAEKAAMGMMDVDGDEEEEEPNYSSIEAPPSVWPPRHYCDITGLEALYTDPATGLRYHDKSVYEIIQGLSPSMVKDYLSARGVNSIVK